MMEQHEIEIESEDIIAIESHGIRFRNADGEEDFIAFMLSHVAILQLALNADATDFRDDVAHQNFLDNFPHGSLVGAYDDEQTSIHQVIMLQEPGGNSFYVIHFESQQAYDDFASQVESYGWEIRLTSELS